jgi:hypothetical protein
MQIPKQQPATDTAGTIGKEPFDGNFPNFSTTPRCIQTVALILPKQQQVDGHGVSFFSVDNVWIWHHLFLKIPPTQP